MKQFSVDDDLVALVWQRANPKPFENLSFSEALRRVLATPIGGAPSKQPKKPISADELLAEIEAMDSPPKNYKIKKRLRASSPKPDDWLERVPELRAITGLNNWQDICEHLGIEVAGDSARRSLQRWVKGNRSDWPAVPDA